VYLQWILIDYKIAYDTLYEKTAPTRWPPFERSRGKYPHYAPIPGVLATNIIVQLEICRSRSTKILRFYLLFWGTDDAHLSEINIPVSINCDQIFVEDFCEPLCVGLQPSCATF